MKIGGKYNLLAIGASEWEKCAAELRVNADAFRSRMSYFTDVVPDMARKVRGEIQAQGIKHDVILRLCTALDERAGYCRKLIEHK